MRHRLLAGISSASASGLRSLRLTRHHHLPLTGAVQTFTARRTGTYQILAFGAQGGSGGATGRPAAAAPRSAATSA